MRTFWTCIALCCVLATACAGQHDHFHTDKPFLQYQASRFPFSKQIADWDALPIAAGTISSVQASCLSFPSHSDTSAASAWLIGASELYLFDPSLFKLVPQRTRLNVTLSSTTKAHVVHPSGCGGDSEVDVLFLFSESLIDINDVDCTASGDVCYLATAQGLFAFHRAAASVSPVALKYNGTLLHTVAVFGANEADTVVAYSNDDRICRLEKAQWSFTWIGTLASEPTGVFDMAFRTDGTLVIATAQALFTFDGATHVLTRFDSLSGLPVNNTNLIAIAGGAFADVVWAGSPQGVVRMDTEHHHHKKPPRRPAVHPATPGPPPAFRYFFGPRWLATESSDPTDAKGGNAVRSLAVSEDGEMVWVLTSEGLSVIASKFWTLEEKALSYEPLVTKRHDRYGLVADCGLKTFGDRASFELRSSDNDGLWTSVYLASQCFRYAVTKDPAVKTAAWHHFEALEMLNNVTGVKGLMARSVLAKGAPIPGGTWHNSTTIPSLQWKADTSSDEVTGHMFVYPIALDLLAETDEEKQRVRTLLLNVANYIVDNNFYLIDVTGKPTSWGVWNPVELNEQPFWFDERGLNSLQMLTFLRIAYRENGDPKFVKAAEFLQSQGYGKNMINLKITVPDDDNFSDDELSFLPYFSWMYSRMGSRARLQAMPDMQTEFELSLNRSMVIAVQEKMAMWNFVYGVHYPKSDFFVNNGLQDAVWCLQTWPVELVQWPVHNSHRLDLHMNPFASRGHGKTMNLPPVLPYDERENCRLTGNPYALDGGDGMSETDPGAFLLPYWLARFFNFIA